MTSKIIKNWADLEEEDELDSIRNVVKDFIPISQTTIDENGIKTVVEYKKENGKLLKITKQYKITTKIKTVPSAVAERANWKPFGKAASSPNTAHTIVSKEEIRIEKPGASDDSDKNVDKIVEQLRKPTGLRKQNEDNDKDKDNISIPEKQKYIPPNKRQGHKKYDNVNTLKVSNLSEDAREEDVRNLFRDFGQISKLSMVKDRETGCSKGLAFVTFYNQKDAKNAQNGLNGYGYDHLILSVQWAEI